jgi:hypothetical protein
MARAGCDLRTRTTSSLEQVRHQAHGSRSRLNEAAYSGLVSIAAASKTIKRDAGAGRSGRSIFEAGVPLHQNFQSIGETSHFRGLLTFPWVMSPW